ncbi:Conserved hypothetical protein [Prochlorococcus marinus str. MIT 9313]|uniref:Uncharacterized protein n=1 Tax=Prochlorococcus marinus (strain MIT 9313) TaxID=74547 RepID=B9ESJ2_PROMM|nr:Conserved hypothetical protein [Prochlorococcus marinus str. MIT 9313]
MSLNIQLKSQATGHSMANKPGTNHSNQELMHHHCKRGPLGQSEPMRANALEPSTNERLHNFTICGESSDSLSYR